MEKILDSSWLVDLNNNYNYFSQTSTSVIINWETLL